MMDRLTALAVIDEVVGTDPLVVTCGATSRELAHHHGRDNHLYLLDSMGLSAAVGLGIALAGDHPVWAIEGDGSLLMGLNALPTLGANAPATYTLIVLDNHQHASADKMPTQAEHVRIADLTAAAGLKTAVSTDPDRLREALLNARSAEGPSAVVARIAGGNAPNIPWLLDDPAAIANRFRQNVLLQQRNSAAPPTGRDGHAEVL
ncbi:thiamine pyrophosphate-dependent enzyme [Saccharopolyspora sp. NPDC050389]|uniref:thiamine pyrophosphate-dependent enzyme n=1 Tax=Saccharopolyspora sp. NPDC050389 TaxID=3155516 RepID=UPI0033CD6E80